MSEFMPATQALSPAEGQDHSPAVIILNPRNFKPTDPREPFSRCDYLGEGYLNSRARLAQLTEQGASAAEIRKEVKLGKQCLKLAREQLEAVVVSGGLSVDHSSQYYQEIAEHLEIRSTKDTPKLLMAAIAGGPDQALAEFIQYNQSYLDRLKQEKQPLLEAYTAEFWARITAAVEEQNLPLDKGQLRARQAQPVAVYFADPLALRVMRKGGDYSPVRRRARLSPAIHDKLVKADLFHELLHYLSGHTMVQKVNERTAEDSAGPPYRRVGLASINGRGKTRKWLNEAITEQLAAILVNKQGYDIDFATIDHNQFFGRQFISRSYEREREILEMLLAPCQNVIGPMLAAYFEDHMPTKQPGRRTAKRRKFYQSLQSFYGKDVMVMLGNLDHYYAQRRFSRMEEYIASEINLCQHA
jgi:hypothetical protein